MTDSERAEIYSVLSNIRAELNSPELKTTDTIHQLALSLPDGYSINVVGTLEASTPGWAMFGVDFEGAVGFSIDNRGLANPLFSGAVGPSFGPPSFATIAGVDVAVEAEYHLARGDNTEFRGFAVQVEGGAIKASGFTIPAQHIPFSKGRNFLWQMAYGDAIDALIDGPAGASIHTGWGSDVGLGLEFQYTFDGTDLQWINGQWQLIRQRAQDAIANQPPYYNSFEEFFLDARKRARTAVWGDRVLNDSDEFDADSVQSLGGDGSFAFDVVDANTGLVSTINQSFIDGTPHLVRISALPSSDSFLQLDFSFSDLDNAFIPGGWSFQGNNFSQQFGDLPDGLVVVAGGPIDFSTDYPNATIPAYDPFQSLGNLGIIAEGAAPTSLNDFTWYSLQDQSGSIVASVGERPADPIAGTPAAQFIRQQDTTQGEGGFRDALIMGGAEAFGAAGNHFSSGNVRYAIPNTSGSGDWTFANFEVTEDGVIVSRGVDFADGRSVNIPTNVANGELLFDTARSLDDTGSFAIDVADVTTGLISTINQSFIDGTPHLVRISALPDTSAFLQSDFSFDDAIQAFTQSATTFNLGDASIDLGPLPAGVSIGVVSPELSPLVFDVYRAAFGTTIDQGTTPLDVKAFNFYDSDSNVIRQVSYAEATADSTTGSPAIDSFVATADFSSGEGVNWDVKATVFDLSGEIVGNGIVMSDGFKAIQTPSADDIISGEDGTDTIDGGAGDDTLDGGTGSGSVDEPMGLGGPTFTFSRPDGETGSGTGFEDLDYSPLFQLPYISAQQIGQIFGSSLSTLVETDNVFAQVSVRTAMETVLGISGATLDAALGVTNEHGQVNNLSLIDASGNFNNNFLPNLGQNIVGRGAQIGIGLASNFLANELADAIGIDGDDFGGQLFTAAASTTINYGLTKVAGGILGSANNTILNGIGEIVAAPSKTLITGLPPNVGSLAGSLGVTVGSLIGSHLASKVVEVKNIGGAIGSSIGSAIGSTIGVIAAASFATANTVATLASTIATSIASVALPGIGAFIGTILGTVVGNWIGNNWQDEGWHHGTLLIRFDENSFATSYDNGHDADFIQPNRQRMSRARAVLNNFIAISQSVGGEVVTSNQVTVEFRLQYNGSDRISYTRIRAAGYEEVVRNSQNSEQLVNVAVMYAVKRLDLEGGDRFVNHQLESHGAATIEQLSLQVSWAANWSQIARVLYSSNNQAADGSDLNADGLSRLLLTFNTRNFNEAMGTDAQAVWRTAREFGRTLNDDTSAVSTKNKDILGVNVVRALLASEVVYMEQLQAQLIAATVFQKTLDLVLSETGGVLAQIALPNLNVGGLMRQTDANGTYIENKAEYNDRIKSFGTRLAREALQANADVMLDGSPSVKAAILQAATNDNEGLVRLVSVAKYFESLIGAILAPAEDAATDDDPDNDTDSAILGGTFTYDLPDFSSVDVNAFAAIQGEQSLTAAIGKEAIRLVKETVAGGLRKTNGDLVSAGAKLESIDGDEIVRQAIVDFSGDTVEAFSDALRAMASFSPTFTSLRSLLVGYGVTFDGFELPDFAAMTILEDDTLDPEADDYAELQEAFAQQQITEFVEQSVLDTLSGAEFEVVNALTSAIRNSTAVTLADFVDQITVAQTFDGIVGQLAKIGIDASSIAMPDFNSVAIDIDAPLEDATAEEKNAYAEAIKLAAIDLISAVETGATGQADAVAAFNNDRELFVEIALATQLRVSGVLYWLTHKERIEIDPTAENIQRNFVKDGEALSLGDIDFSAVDLTALLAATDEGTRDIELSAVADALAFQALRTAQISNGDPYELSVLYSPTITNYSELSTALVSASRLSGLSDNPTQRSIAEALIVLNPDSKFSGEWVHNVIVGAVHGIRLINPSEFDLGVANRLTTLENAGSLADLSVEVRNNGLAIVRAENAVISESDSVNPIILPDITDEAHLAAAPSDATNPVTGTGSNDLWIAGDGGEAFTDAATLADGEVSHDVLLGGAGNDVINAGLGNDYALGGLGNDQIDGGDGDDVLEGGAGDDLLIGGAGNDTFLFKQGFGNDTIQNQGASVDTTDIIAFGSGFTSEQIWFERLDNDLTVTDLGSDNTINIEGWYADPAAQVDVFQLADGSTLAAGDIEQLISAMAAFNPADFGASAGSAQQPLPDDVRLAMNSTWQSTS